jgi:DNA-binding NarL/FixJ family response regulator
VPASLPGHVSGEVERPRFLITLAEERLMPYILSGSSNKEIASAVGRAEATIKNQVASILQKFGVPSRTRLISHYWTGAPVRWCCGSNSTIHVNFTSIGFRPS